jgi:DNA repair protein RecO (recombination protein O)
MLQNTRGVVLSHIKYRETSLIVKIYTEAFGLQTYIVNGVRSSKSSKSKSAFFQPLMLLDLIVYHKDGQSMHHIKEIKTAYIFKTIPYEHKKCVIAIFLSEILQKTIKEHYKNPELFEFIYDSLVILDEQKNDYENFHLLFMLQYASYLGFAPQDAISFFEEVGYKFNPTELTFVTQLFNANQFVCTAKGNNQTRRFILDKIIYLYQLHVDNIGVIKSFEVLKEIMD